jgi:hypothetical protein
VSAIGGYDFRLQCDGAECSERQKRAGIDSVEFHGATLELNYEHGSQCRSSARRRGWKFDMVAGWAFCPLCVDLVPTKKKKP